MIWDWLNSVMDYKFMNSAMKNDAHDKNHHISYYVKVYKYFACDYV